MTEKERAQEYEENAECIEIDDSGHKVYGSLEIEQAWLAGFEAGRIKWHKVADGDLPESLMSVINQDGEKVMYNDYCKTWRYDDTNEYFCATPIAWCEIPKFEE